MAKKNQRVARVLAEPGDPLVLATGAVIFPNPNPVGNEPHLIQLTPQTFKPQKRRTRKELSAPVPVMNGIGATFMYSVLGLGDREICDVCNITINQLNDLRKHPAYTEFFNTVMAEFINANSGLLQARIAAMSGLALTKVFDISQHGKHEGNQLKASDSILDRNKETARITEQQQNNELRILVIDEREDGAHGVQLELNGTEI
jgi:hypothetical protein